MLYGVDCWLVKNSHVQKMTIAEMSMLRWMCELTRRDMVGKKDTRAKVEMASVADKMREARLR